MRNPPVRLYQEPKDFFSDPLLFHSNVSAFLHPALQKTLGLVGREDVLDDCLASQTFRCACGGQRYPPFLSRHTVVTEEVGVKASARQAPAPVPAEPAPLFAGSIEPVPAVSAWPVGWSRGNGRLPARAASPDACAPRAGIGVPQRRSAPSTGGARRDGNERSGREGTRASAVRDG